jgi:hypothetical protein
MEKMGNQFIRIAAWLSQGVNVLLLGGHHDETVSARAYRRAWPLRHVINAIFFFQEDHCYQSHMWDIKWASELLESRHD